VAHRDYTDNGSVQVMLFADRLEVWNPGTLPPTLTLAHLREPHGSVPGNPLLAEPMYLAQYIERMGTGTGDMIRHCREAGLPEPEFSLSNGFRIIIRRKTGVVADEVTDEVTGEVASQPESQPESIERMVLELLVVMPLPKSELSRSLGQKEISGHHAAGTLLALAHRTRGV
jgi:predicted HTH transcriptional regulator